MAGKQKRVAAISDGPPMDNDIAIAVMWERDKMFFERMADFVTSTEFQPVKLITYGMAALALLGVLGTIFKKAGIEVVH